MNPYLIVGGGIAGLTAARLLKEKNIPFIGLEKADHLGGRAEVGHHRLYSDRSVEFLSRFSPENEWIRIDEEARERRKGEWIPLHDDLDEAEKFYLRPSFLNTKLPFQKLLAALAEPVKDAFHVKKAVEKIDPTTKTLTCQDGSQYTFEKLVWCTDLKQLPKLWTGDTSAILKALKKTGDSFSGLNLDFELKEPLFEFKNSVLFQFRYKDKKLRTIGVFDAPIIHWMLFLDEEIAEDREEVAKCVRTLKRELQKEFPTLKDSITKERIVYFPSLSGDPSSAFKSLEIVPGVLYIGPQASLEDSDSTLMNMDRTFDNIRHFEEMITSP